MVNYATTENAWRSRMLLRYLGEKNEHDCGLCDVCIARRRDTSLSTDHFSDIRQQIIELLSDQPLTPTDIINRLSMDKEKVMTVLKHLIDEEEIMIKDGFYSLSVS